MRILIAPFLLLSSACLAQPSGGGPGPAPYVSSNVNITGGKVTGTALSATSLNGAVFFANQFGSCTWDGAHDVSPCIQLAINAAVAASNAEVDLPAGILPITTALTSTGGFALHGTGPGTILQPTSSNVGNVLLLRLSSVSDVAISDLTFDGGGESSTLSVPLTQLYRTSYVTLRNVGWQNAAGIGLNGSGVNNTSIINPYVYKVGNRWKATLLMTDAHQGLSLCCGDGVTLGFNNSITGGYFADIGLDAINPTQQTRLVVANNQFYLYNNASVLIGSSFVGSGAIYPAQSSYVSITGNVIDHATGNAIDAPGLREAAISGNTITASGGAGVGLFQAGDVVTMTASISGNTLTVGSISSGTLAIGMVVSGTNVAVPTYITAGGGTSWTLSGVSQTVVSESMYAGTNVRDVAVTGNTILDSNQLQLAVNWIAGVTAGDGIPDGVTVTGNILSDDQVTPTQTYGFAAILGNGVPWAPVPVNLSVTDNVIRNNITAPIFLNANAGVNLQINNNNGVDDVIVSVASATTLAFPINPVITLTGTTGVTSITGPAWINKTETILPTGIVTFTAGNNIANSYTTAANVPVTALYDGTLWHLK
jgi:hypothetical protein